MNRVIKQQLTDKLLSGSLLVEQFLAERVGGNKFQRQIYFELSRHLNNFLQADKGSKWLIMPGLRGVGKTTLLAQLFVELPSSEKRKFYLSLDTAKKIGADMLMVEEALEGLLGHQLDQSGRPVFIFLDEVHFMADWSLVIKTWLDNNQRLFVVCTGSSALILQTNPDIARRADIIKIDPVSLSEFVTIKQVQEQIEPLKFPDKDLGERLRRTLFESSSVGEVERQLRAVAPIIEAYWSDIDWRVHLDDYLLYGSLAFALELRQIDRELFNITVWKRIMRTLDDVLMQDIASLGKFDNHTLAAFSKLLFCLVYADARSLNKLARDINLNINTVQSMLVALTQSEVITAIKARGSGRGHVRKPHKYFFNSPATRAALAYEMGLNLLTDSDSLQQLRGHLLEDAVASRLKGIFADPAVGGFVEYDPVTGGADFIVSRTGLKKDAVVIEVGVNKKDMRQVRQTLQAGGRYGLVVSATASSCLEFEVDKESRVVAIPAASFLLLQQQSL